MTHLETIRAGLAIVRDALSSMEEDVLRRQYGDKWWKTAVLLPLERDGKLPYGWPESGNAGDLDLQTALKLVSVYHWELFADTFDWKGRERSLLQVMIAIRNNYEGHVTPNREKELTASVTDELLEGMARFLRMFDKKAARRLDEIEVSRDEPMQTPPPPRAVASAPKPAPPVRELREAAPAQDPDEVEYRDTPLSPEEQATIEASGYKSLWDEEDEEPITFYSRKPTPPPPPPPKPKTVLYRGVRVEEARPVDDGPRYSALNLQDLRRREERRAASQPPPASKVEPEAPEEEDFPDLEPIARAEKRRVPERARRTGSARKAHWEQNMASVDADTRTAIRRSVRESETPPVAPRAPRVSLFTGKQKLILVLLALAGIAIGLGLLFLDGWLRKLWFG